MKILVTRTLVCLSIFSFISYMLLLDVVYNTTQSLFNDSSERNLNNVGLISQYSKATHRQSDMQNNPSVNFSVTELIGDSERKTIFTSRFDSASSNLYDNKFFLKTSSNHDVNLIKILN